jgi:nucleotide-binding universal stress UspA family protein
VLRLPTRFEYGQMDAVARAKQQGTAEANAYLRNMEQCLLHSDLAQLDLRVSSSVAVNMDVAEALISMAEHGEENSAAERFDGADILVLATNGRSGIERLLKGSVTERILGATTLPLLIVRAAPERDDLSDEAEATYEGPGITTGAQTGETGGTAAEVPTWVGLF